MNVNKFRHEYKIAISPADYRVLFNRLSAILDIDENANENKSYRLHSLYFDNLYDKALREKISGLSKRDKFRIRYYNNDTNFIKLEKKSKINNICSKVSEKISYQECLDIINGNYNFLKYSDSKLFNELYFNINSNLLRPKVIISYDRNPFIYKIGNVRITLDYNIRTSIYNVKNFLNMDNCGFPVIDESIILEIKYDEFLPDFIKNIVSLNGRIVSSYSKYYRGRSWG